MRSFARHKKLAALALLCLLLGAFNYYLFQPGIYLFKFLPFHPERTYYITDTFIRHFMTGYFSDICWCCSLYLVMVLLTELEYLHVSGKIIILSLPFIVEIAQYFHIIPGVFDWFDLLTYGIILIVFLKLFHLTKSTTHEQN